MIGRTFDINTLHESNMSLPPGRYSTIRQVVSAINSAFARTKTPLSLLPITLPESSKSDDKRSYDYKLRFKAAFDSSKYDIETSRATLTISSNLANMLGFTNANESVEFEFINNENKDDVGYGKTKFEPNLNIGLPTNFLVLLDVLETQAVGCHHFPLLQLLNIPSSSSQTVHNYQLRENNVAFLMIKMFTRMNIKITNVHGEEIKADNDLPTIVHLDFTQCE